MDELTPVLYSPSVPSFSCQGRRRASEPQRNWRLVSIILLFGLCRCSFSQDSTTYHFPVVVVESSRLSLTEAEMNRSTTVIDSASFHALDPRSVEDALSMYSTIELRRRGAMGIQTDIGIRGSTFSQQAILLDGIRINDPQTAHHNFDIPLAMSTVKQVEIVRGPSSSHFGPDAYGGIVNIVTAPAGQGAGIEVSGGQNGYAGGAMHAGFFSGRLRSSTGVEYDRSDGYRFDTQFEKIVVSTVNAMHFDAADVHLMAGYAKKDFGAYDFYSPGLGFPSHEKTQTVMTSLGANFALMDWEMASHLSFRHHDDDFIFTILNPEYSHSKHHTNTYTARVGGRRALSTSFIVEPSVEFSYDHINSTKLGIHGRNDISASAIARWLPLSSLSIDAGARLDLHSGYGAQLHPVIGAGFEVDERNKIFASFGTSFREPSYTDLYYSDLATVGNAALKPETGISFEAGYRFHSPSTVEISAVAFYRDQKDLIDFVQHYSGDLFHAENFSSAAIRGAEVQGRWDFSDGRSVLRTVMIGYTFIESDLNTAGVYRTRYALTHPKHQVDGALTAEFPFGLLTTFGGTYLSRPGSKDRSSVSMTLIERIGAYDLILKADNLFNEPYEEIPGIPLPGRWITGAVRMNIG